MSLSIFQHQQLSITELLCQVRVEVQLYGGRYGGPDKTKILVPVIICSILLTSKSKAYINVVLKLDKATAVAFFLTLLNLGKSHFCRRQI